jgi:hypothetical protein
MVFAASTMVIVALNMVFTVHIIVFIISAKSLSRRLLPLLLRPWHELLAKDSPTGALHSSSRALPISSWFLFGVPARSHHYYFGKFTLRFSDSAIQPRINHICALNLLSSLFYC